jgi:hypothetical protein
VRQHGRAAVVAVIRTIGLSSPDPSTGHYSSITLAVEAPGSEPCDFVLRSILRPEPDAKRYASAMAALVNKPVTGYVEPTDNSAATAQACQHPSG